MRTALTILALGLAAALAASGTAGERAPLDLSQRVDARVLADTSNGKTGHFLVVLRRQADVSGLADSVSDRDALGNAVVDRLRNAARAQAPLTAELDRHGVPYRPFWIVNAIAVTGGRALVDAFAARSDVERIEPDRAFRGLDATTAQPAARTRATGIAWGVAKIQAPAVWNLGFTGQGMVYANADTGIQWDHPALRDHYRGWNGSSAVHDYNWHDAIHGDIDGDAANPCGFNTTAPCDDNVHGTHTTGTGIGDDGAGNQIGVAPGAKFIGCRNMEEGVGRPSTYIECLQFFTAPTNLAGGAPNPSLRPHAIGNSYGCPPSELCSPTSLQTAVENVRSAGIFMSVSAGNSGSACGTVNDPPALYDASITVGSTDMSDVIAASSSRGPVLVDASGRPKPDLAAPGVQVPSSVPGNLYATFSGTSMAAPHVGGAVLLLWSAIPSLVRNVDATEALLEQTAVHKTTTNGCGGDSSSSVPNNTYGYGRIDVLAAYNAAQGPTAVSKISGGNILVGEGTRRTITANVTVKLSAARPSGVAVAYRTVDGTAKAGSDYRAVFGTLRFLAKQTVKRVAIPIVRDAKREPNETLFLVLEKPLGGTVATPRVRVTIRNDDR